jgi:hypothetical protein
MQWHGDKCISRQRVSFEMARYYLAKRASYPSLFAILERMNGSLNTLIIDTGDLCGVECFRKAVSRRVGAQGAAAVPTK